MAFIDHFISALKGIIKGTNQRVERAYLGDEESLKRGIWYGAEYYRVLTARQKKKQILFKEPKDMLT